MRKVLRKLPLIIVLAALAGGLFFLFRPQPVAVDLARVEKGELVVTVDEDGKTRIKQRYIVAAPLAGKLQRIHLKPGDSLVSPLAIIEPSVPLLLDERSQAEARARVSAAESRRRKAKTELDRAIVAENFARAEHERQKSLGVAASKQDLASAANLEETTTRDRKATEYGVEVADFELKLAQAALDFGTDFVLVQRLCDVVVIVLYALLQDYGNGFALPESERGRFIIPTPIVRGKVLKVHQESETVVAPGTLLIEVGDPESLEAEIDVLTTDAVKIKQNCLRVELVHWGAGDETLEGRVRLVEPSGFMKPSALGVEEQRVNVIVDFTIPPKYKGAIGENYRVEARFVIWESKSVLKVKEGALFTKGGRDAVFVKRGDRAELQHVKVGKKNGIDAEVEGLEVGDEVVLHPGDRVKDGGLIQPRSTD